MSSLAEQLRSKLRRGLQPTTTKVTTADGRVTLYENQGRESVEGTTTVACCGYVVDMKPDLSISYVLPWLCITSQDVPREPGVLQKEKITHVLSLLPGFLLDQEVISNLVEHKIVEILDEDNINGELTKDAEEKIFDAVAYIQNTHQANPSHKILVHCNAVTTASYRTGVAYKMGDAEKGMDWMYKGPAALVNREDYLTGRSIDNALKLLDETEKGNGGYSYLDEVEKDLTPVSIFSSRGPAGAVDVIRKVKDDPLYKIQKLEEERLRELLDNPLRLKKLKELAAKNKSAGPSTSAAVSKSDSSKTRHRSSSESSSSSDDNAGDIDKLLAEKLKSLKNPKDVISESRKSRRYSSSDEDRRKKSSYRDRRDSDRYKREDHRRRSRSRSRDRNSDTNRRDFDRFKRDNRNERGNTSSSRYNNDRRDSKRPEPTKKSIDESEREKRLKEMMENSKWRDEQRSKNVEKHRVETKKEEELQKSKHDAEFIRKQLIEAANKGSVEKRIKANSYNIQRSHSSMDQNFAKR